MASIYLTRRYILDNDKYYKRKFSNLKMEVGKIWGYEKWITNTQDYCCKEIGLNPNYRCSIHHHRIKDETFYVVSGAMILELWNGNKRNARLMRAGDFQRVLPGQEHRFTGLEKTVFIEASTHHEDSDSYRREESGRISQEELEKLKEEIGYQQQ